ncbi:MAG TPA: SRPBCC family protein [Steroidobacteraceae bacterium]|jgi:uncharacterized protein YndB with AHSA1/START domain
MTHTIHIAPVRKSILANVDARRAFEVFTAGIDRWWPKSHSIASAPKQTVIEPFVGGRWFVRCEDGSEVINGHVLVWEPGRRLLLSWEISADWKPDSSVSSEVEVNFVTLTARSTRVELEHRNLERLGPEGGEKMRNAVDGGWPMLLQLFVAEAQRAAG